MNSGRASLMAGQKEGYILVMHKRYDKEFKAKVALESLRGERTIQEIATAYAVHPNLVSLWKRQIIESAGKVFEKEGKDKEASTLSAKQDELYKQIGQLQVENDFQKKVQATIRDRAAKAVDPEHPELSVKKQCELLDISRAAYYYRPRAAREDQEVALLMAILDELKERPFYGYRKIARAVADLSSTEKQVRRVMKKAGLRAIYPGKRTSIPNKAHHKYLYLLKGKAISFPNQVWTADITYIRFSGGHVFLVAIIDLFSRRVLSWKISNTLDADFCVSALEEAIACYGIPAILNTDQGCQFTSDAFTSKLSEYGIRISMDGKNRAIDNIYVERFWRTLK